MFVFQINLIHIFVPWIMWTSCKIHLIFFSFSHYHHWAVSTYKKLCFVTWRCNRPGLNGYKSCIERGKYEWCGVLFLYTCSKLLYLIQIYSWIEHHNLYFSCQKWVITWNHDMVSGHNIKKSYLLKGELHPKPKLSMFCVLSQNLKHNFEE